MSFGTAIPKAEGESVTDSWTYKAAGRYTDALSRPQLSFQEGDRTIVVSDMLMRLEYILQRTVPNYDELVSQYNAIKDIERCSNDIR